MYTVIQMDCEVRELRSIAGIPINFDKIQLKKNLSKTRKNDQHFTAKKKRMIDPLEILQNT